jgi:hypothetical protein
MAQKPQQVIFNRWLLKLNHQPQTARAVSLHLHKNAVGCQGLI